jgi:hypothetical protein
MAEANFSAFKSLTNYVKLNIGGVFPFHAPPESPPSLPRLRKPRIHQERSRPAPLQKVRQDLFPPEPLPPVKVFREGNPGIPCPLRMQIP